MEFAEIVRRRRMVRRFEADRPVPARVRDAMLHAAVRTPSAGFSQGVSLLVLEDPTDRDRFWTATSPVGGADRWLTRMRAAPLLIMVWTSEAAYRRRYGADDKAATGSGSGRPDETWSAPFWYVDAGMVVLAALYAVVDSHDDPDDHDELGACFFGVPQDRVAELRAAFGVPGEQLVVGVIGVGYRPAGERPAGSPTRRRRKPDEEIVRLGRW